MIRRILVAIDGEDSAGRLIPWVRLVTADAPLVLLRIFAPVYSTAVVAASGEPTLDPEVRQAGLRFLESISRKLAPGACLVVRSGFFAPLILQEAARASADLIAVAPRSDGVHDLPLFGGTTERLLYGADLSLLAVTRWERRPGEPNLGRILVPLDGSRAAEEALSMARRLAQIHGSEILLAHARGQAHAGSEGPEQRLAQLGEKLREEGFRASTAFARGSAPEALARLADEREADLVVMARHGSGSTNRMISGGVASRLIRFSTVPVLALRRPRVD
jgi:nucleotide-binding universal stress UspA family protein